jgi:hypothetical protein
MHGESTSTGGDMRADGDVRTTRARWVRGDSGEGWSEWWRRCGAWCSINETNQSVTSAIHFACTQYERPSRLQYSVQDAYGSLLGWRDYLCRLQSSLRSVVVK